MRKGPAVSALLASELWQGSTAQGLLSGLQAHGWSIEKLDERDYIPPPSTLFQRAQARVLRGSRIKRYNREISRAAHALRPDVFLTVKGANISSKTLSLLREAGTFSVNYYPDCTFNDVPIEAMTDYDLIATTKSFHVLPLQQILPEQSVTFIHHGYGDNVHRPVPVDPAASEVDVLYIGNATSTKAALMISIAEALPQVRFRVVGSRWKSAAAGTALARAVAGYQAVGDDYAAEVARAKIVLAFHMGVDKPTGFEDLVSTRTFEIPACGGFMLHVDNDEVRSLYDVPSEIDTFRTPAELVEKIRYWLARPAERAAVAARGHARAVPAYGYIARALELAALIEKRLGR